MIYGEYLQHYAKEKPIYWAGGIPWSTYKTILRPISHPHDEPQLQKGEMKRLLEQSKAPLAMWTNDYGVTQSNWWYVVAKAPYSLEKLRSKARYNVRRGLKLCNVKIISAALLSSMGYDCYQSAMRRHSQSTPIDKAGFQAGIMKYENNPAYTIWGVFHNNQLAGYALYKVIDDISYEGDIILAPEFFKDHSTYALLHTTTDYYLNQSNCSQVVCGWRSISHQSAFQEFTIKEFMRQKVHCRLGVEFSKSYGFIAQFNYLASRILNAFPLPMMVKNKLQVLYELEKIRREGISK